MRVPLIGLPTESDPLGHASPSAPGVAHHEPGGPGGIVGADVVELHPPRDLNGITATLTAKLVKELASLVPGARP